MVTFLLRFYYNKTFMIILVFTKNMEPMSKEKFVKQIKEAIKEADKINDIWDKFHKTLIINRSKNGKK